MAGIGFELRKTLSRRTFTAYVRAYMAALAYASGPWICTIFALGGIVALAKTFLEVVIVEQFTVTTVYVYAFSLLLSGPFQIVTTRYVSDRLFEKKEELIAPGVTTALALVGSLSVIIGAICSYLADLPSAIELSAVFLFCLVNCLWIVMSYISCLKNYRLVTVAFTLGMAIAWGAALALAKTVPYPLLGLIWGYTAGHLFIFILLVYVSFRELPGDWSISRDYLSYISRFPLLLIVGLLTNLAIWIDKFVIWGFHGTAVWGLFLFYPPYDIPAYLAYLTAIPSTAFFLIKVETNFAEHYEQFIKSLLVAPAAVVEQRKREMINGLRAGIVQLLTFQGVITLVFIMVAPKLLSRLWLGNCPPTLFRTLLVAAYCHFAFLHIIIFLMYFDKRRHLVALLFLFVILSGLGSYYVAKMGIVANFGLGYMGAAAVSAALAGAVLFIKVEEADGDILFMQPLLDARGEVIEFKECSDDTYGGRVLLDTSGVPMQR